MDETFWSAQQRKIGIQNFAEKTTKDLKIFVVQQTQETNQDTTKRKTNITCKLVYSKNQKTIQQQYRQTTGEHIAYVMSTSGSTRAEPTRVRVPYKVCCEAKEGEEVVEQSWNHTHF